MNLVTVTPPAVEPVTLDEAKLQLRVEVADDDTLINRLLAVARQLCEAYHGRAYVTRTLRLELDRFPAVGIILLPYPPAQSVGSVKYDNSAGVEVTLEATAYYLDAAAEPARLAPAPGTTWPSTQAGKAGAVRIVYDAGYGDAAADVPEYVKQAILVRLADLYEYRESVVAGAQAVTTVEAVAAESLLAPTRVYWQGNE